MSAARYPMPPFPDGWYRIAASDDVAPGQERELRYFGEAFTLGRDADGVLQGGGRPLCERDGLVLAYHHARGAAPGFEIPDLRPHEEAWTDWSFQDYRVRVHVQDLSENILDRQHFQVVHDMAASEEDRFRVAFEGPRMVVEQSLRVVAAKSAGVEILSTTTNHGPGISHVLVQSGPIRTVTLIAQTPVDDECVHMRLHFSMCALADPEATRHVCAQNERITHEQFRQDVPIWEHKTYWDRPLLVEADGPIARYRDWYRQFYSGWDGEGAACS